MSLTTTAMPASVLRIADLDARQIRFLLDLAAGMKERPTQWRKTLRAQSIALYFAKPSTRSRVSWETASHRLGALPIMAHPGEPAPGRGEEPIADTARVLSGYSAAIIMRAFTQEDVEQMSRWASVPVINALTESHHPCQALADLLTLFERFGDLHGLHVAYVGDGNHVAHSLMEACALMGIHLSVAAPLQRQPSHEVTKWARAAASASGGSISLKTEPRAAVEGAHAVYTDAWPGVDETEQETHRLELAGYQVSADLMKRAQPGALFMHGLPARRGEEVAAEVIDGVQSAVWEQAANRLPTEQALLWALTTAASERS